MDILYTARVQAGLVDARGIDHCAERAGMVIIALLFLLLLGCKVGEWRLDRLFQISYGHCCCFVGLLDRKFSLVWSVEVGTRVTRRLHVPRLCKAFNV